MGLIEAINEATRAWTRHMLGECDDDCPASSHCTDPDAHHHAVMNDRACPACGKR